MTNNREERNRFLGFPVRPDPYRGPSEHRGPSEEQQHVMGFPADWLQDVNLDGLRSLAHPVREYRRWAQRRRLGS